MNHPLDTNQTVSVGKGLLICKLFFSHLWPLIGPKLPPKNPETMTYEMHEIFCTIVCKGDRASVEWIEAVHRTKKLSKEQQKSDQLSLEDLFAPMVEFCKIYDKRYDSDLSFLLQMLALMKQSPDQYPEEWNIFKKAISDGLARCYSPELTYTPYLDWDTQFSEAYLLSVEEGFYACATFFTNLWLLLDPTNSLYNSHPYLSCHIFCQSQCVEGLDGPAPEGHAEWNEIVSRLKSCPKEQQKKLKLTTNEIFLCMIDFCKLYNKKHELWGVKGNYEANLHFIIELLQSMQKKAKDSKEEWALFKQSIESSINFQTYNSFDWDAVFHKDEYNE